MRASGHPGYDDDSQYPDDAVDVSMTEADVRESERFSRLGPAYFAARRMAEALMSGVEAEPLKQVATKCADDMRDKLYEYVEDHLRSDLEANLQHYICDTVERTVEALLTGQEWAMRQYPFADYQRGESIRAEVAKHGGDELLNRRIADLEKEVARLRESLEWARR